MEHLTKTNTDRILSILTVIVLVCTFFSGLSCFTSFTSDGEVSFYFDFYNLPSFIFLVAPAVFLGLFIYKFRDGKKATLLLSLIFGAYALSSLWNFLVNLIFYAGSTTGLNVIVVIPVIVYALAVWSLISGRNKKLFPIIAIGFRLLAKLLYLNTSITHARQFFDTLPFLWILNAIADVLGIAALFGAVFLIVRNHKLPPLIHGAANQETSVEPMDYAQQLRQLNEQLQNGALTEEEYRQLREDIINNL